jgi:hypothetical protein
VVLREDDYVAIADQPSLQCGKAATRFMLNTKNTIIGRDEPGRLPIVAETDAELVHDIEPIRIAAE